MVIVATSPAGLSLAGATAATPGVAAKQAQAQHVLAQIQQIDGSIETQPWGERMFYAKDPFGSCTIRHLYQRKHLK